MQLSKQEVAFATEVIRKLVVSSIKDDDPDLLKKVAQANLKQLIVIGENVLNINGWEATSNPCVYKVGDVWKGKKIIV